MERIIFQVDFDNANAKKKVNELEKSIMDLKTAQTNLKNSYNAGLISQEQYIEKNQELNQSIKNLKNEQKSYQNELDLVDRAMASNSLSYQELANATALAEKQLKQMQGTLKINKDGSVELSEEYEKQSAKVNQLRETLISFDQQIKNGKSNVGNYSSAVAELKKENDKTKEAFKNLNDTFGGTFATFGQGVGAVGTLKASFISLWTTLLANPFIALAAALTAVVGYFLSTEKGGKKLQVMFAGLTALIAPLLSMVSSLGEALFSAVEGVIDFAASFSSGYENAKALEKQMQGLEVRAKKMEVISAKNLADQEKLKNFRDDELNSYEARAKANEQAFAMERKRGEELVKLKEEELQALRTKLEMTPENLRTLEMQTKIMEKEKDIQDTIADTLGKQNEYITEGNGLLRDRLTLQADIKTAQLETQILEGKIAKGSVNELKARKDLAKERLKIDLKQYEQGVNLQKLGIDYFILSEDDKIKRILANNENAKLSYANYLQETAQLSFDFNEEQKEKGKEAADNFAKAQIAGLETIKLAYTSFTNDRLKTEIDLVRANLRQQLLDTSLSLQERQKLNKEAEIQINQLKLDFQNRNNTAILESQKLATSEGTKARLDAEIKLLENQRTIDLQNAELTAEERKKIETDYNTQIDELTQSFSDLQLQRQTRLNESLQNLKKQSIDFNNKLELQGLETLQTDLDEAIQKRGFALEEELYLKQELQQSFFDTQKSQIEQQTNFEIDKVNAKLEADKQALLDRLGAGAEYDIERQALQQEADLQVLALEQSQAQQSIDIETNKVNALKALDREREASQIQQLSLTGEIIGKTKEFFSENTIAYKLLATSEAIISTYLAANKAFAQGGGVPFGSILAGLTIAQGLATVARINSVPTMAKGGIFGGKPHSSGGTKGYFEDGTMIEVEKGEAFAVVNKKNTPLLNTLSSVNSFNGNGVPYFQSGGLMGLSNSILNNSMQSNAMIEVLRMIPAPILQISELNRVQNNVNVVENLANS